MVRALIQILQSPVLGSIGEAGSSGISRISKTVAED
ncbi:MAG: hypothetical protein HW374_1246, partial [Bacteroidetes bacterium]|nr:hypothetical protein [Bacteroidota bacterium]